MSLADSMESLKKFDINELDFNTAGTWPGPIKAIFLAIIFAVVVGGGYWFLVKDMYSDLERVAKEETELKQQYESKAFKVANLQVYRDQMIEMEKSFGTLLKQLPSDTEVPGLLEDITNTGLSSGLNFKSIELKPEVKREFYIELPIQVNAEGTYHDLAAFVSNVAGLPRIVTLHDFSISPTKANPEILSMQILAKTYRYKSGG